MAEEDIRPEVYYIPENFEDAGGVLGGRLTTRNAIEMAVLCGPLAFIETKLFFGVLNLGLQLSAIIMMFTIVPLAALAAFGIGGESLSQLLLAYIRFSHKRRKLSYVEFTDKLVLYSSNLMSLDGILDSISSDGIKGTLLKIKKYRETMKQGEMDSNAEDWDDTEDMAEEELTRDIPENIPHEERNAPDTVTTVKSAPKRKERKTRLSKKEKKPRKAASKSQAKKKAFRPKAKQNILEKPKREPAVKQKKEESVWMKSAMREVLLKKLELGDDDEDEF